MTIDMVKKTTMAYQGSEPESVPKRASGTDSEVNQVKLKTLEKNASGLKPENKEAEHIEITEQRNDSVKRAVEEINKKAKQSEAIFGIHDSTNRVTIKIVDKETRDVIREYPPEKTLDMIAKVWELAGIMIDVKR